jgi:Bacterial tandem repeat domain 1
LRIAETPTESRWTEGWRLYILDSYVISDGTVRYNAVWRPATHAETQIYDWTYSTFRTEYNKLWTEGWRLYILNTYVLPGDVVRYDAVWQEGTVDRPL